MKIELTEVEYVGDGRVVKCLNVGMEAWKNNIWRGREKSTQNGRRKEERNNINFMLKLIKNQN